MTNRELFFFVNGLASKLGAVPTATVPTPASDGETTAFVAGKLAPKLARVAVEAVMSTAGLALGLARGATRSQVEASFGSALGRYEQGSPEYVLLDVLRAAWLARVEETVKPKRSERIRPGTITHIDARRRVTKVEKAP